MNRRDLLVALLLLALSAVFFAPVIFFDRVLVPFDNLFRFPPWSAFAAQFGVTVPHNELVSDLVLENYVWKKLIVDSIRAREIPLWNPYLFAGIPFLAAGQHSALYPLSVIFYVLPIDRAYGVLVALQLAIAGIAMYVFGRVLGLERFGAAIAGTTYAFSAFMVVSTTFPMVIAVAAWLPGILACVELIFRQSRSSPSEPALATPPGESLPPSSSSASATRQLFFALVGAILVGVVLLAGHVEISMYVLIVTAFFAIWRGLARVPSLNWRGLGAVALMIALGITLALVQLVPLYELVRENFRSGSVSYADVIGWAYPPRQIITFLIPDFFGNPTHHSYFDVFDLTSRAAPTGTIFWGQKNYVEAGSYVGILPLAFGLVTLISFFGLLRSRGPWPLPHLKSNVAFFAVLGLISLLFVFGTPLYAVLFFLAPGVNQLHSPFRWVLPYTLSMAALAGIGASLLARHAWSAGPRLLRLLPGLLIALGSAVLAALGLSWVVRGATLSLLDRVIESTNVASTVFDSGRMFYSYEFRNLLIFSVLLISAGLVIRAARSQARLPTRLGGGLVWQALALLLVFADLAIIGFGFYPSADPRLAQFTPPAVDFLLQDQSLYRITSYDNRGDASEKVFNPNAGMLFGLSDIRGYDSIIPKQYAELMGLLAPQDELLQNRIASFYDPDPLSAPLLNLLNVKYVLTKRPVPNAGYTLVYDKEIQIYRNDRVLPRAFVVPTARVVPDRGKQLEEMKSLDPTREVLLDLDPGAAPIEISSSTCSFSPVTFEGYSLTRVTIRSEQACPGWLVLADSYFPGWIAQVDGQDVPLYRANYNFRAVRLPDGAHTVQFKYSPLSFRVGLIGSFLGGMVLLLGFAYVAWRRFYRPEQETEVRVVAKNSLLPMATSLLMNVMDFAFAAFWLRVLGPTDAGSYRWAMNLWVFANTVTDFGLGILLTREVSRDRTRANRYLTNATILRILIWALSILPFGVITAVYVAYFDVSINTALTFGLFMLGILPSTIAASLAFLFNAFERFEYRVAVDVMTRVLAVTLGVIALLLGYGYLGLAAVSILTNLFTLTSFYMLVRRMLFVPRLEVDRPLIRTMFRESYPLMLNNLLSGLFFRIDTMILQPAHGNTVLGYYGTAYAFVDKLNFIPSNFTLAIFPVLSRMAASAKDAMLRAYVLSLKYLLWVALPITVGTVFVARELILVFGGDAYLPHSAVALQFLIWFLPFSFINSITHYVLIALGQQRFLTKAFLLGVAFNVVTNLIVIPPMSYVGASIVTILSEVVLLLPFYYSVRKNLASIPFWSIAWRPVVASGLMGLVLWGLLPHVGLLIAVPLAGILYFLLMIGLGALGPEERALLKRLLPGAGPQQSAQ